MIYSKTVHASNKQLQKVIPRTENQKKLVDLLNKEKPYIVVASGAAGSGKTLLSVSAAVKQLSLGHTDKIVITRPAVSVDESHGFLPGDLNKKMQPWIRPIHDVLRLYFPTTKIESMIKDKIIDIVPIAFMRGLSLENCWIICDEAQNTTISQMQMILTRIGKNSKMVITGDPSQYDRGFQYNGLSDLLQRLEYHPIIDENNEKVVEVINFTEEDVERHEVVKYIIGLYET